MAKITVKDTEINITKFNDEDYICITDMLKAKDGEFFVTDWLRNRNTLEYIGTWENVYNPEFDFNAFSQITNKSGLNSFKISVKEFVERTKAISITAKAGRYGGTYAHKDIAFEFAMWISPEFKIYIVKKFQRLKNEEQKQLGWSAKRELAKINYRIHGKHLSEFKRKLEQTVGYDKIQLVTISRPSAYGEYEPYRFVDTKEEFAEAVGQI